MISSMSLPRRSLALVVLLATLPASAVQLKKSAADAFNHYVQLTEARINQELSGKGAFLAVDEGSDQQRQAAHARLRNGEVVIERRHTLDNGKPIEAPDAMIHHWIGTVFAPGVTLPQVLALVQDYNNHSRYYAPQVTRSTLKKHEGNNFKVSYRLRQKKVITVVLETDYDVLYQPISPTRETSRSYSTRIQEVDNPGERDERLKPVDDGNGFMWRLYTYWRFEQKDGGVYVQCEAVSLSRDIPTGLGWMIGPFVESVPRESLAFTLGKTREALLALPKK